jgi:hypothetical protein
MTQFAMRNSILASIDDVSDTLPLIRTKLEENYNSENSLYFDKFITKTYFLEKMLRGLKDRANEIDGSNLRVTRILLHDIARIESYVEFMEDTANYIIDQKD